MHAAGLTRPNETGADGLVPVRTIGAEYFRYHEDKHALIGTDSGETYRLGDAVTVRLVEAAPVAGALRFELLSEGRHDTRRHPRPSRGVNRLEAGKGDGQRHRRR